MGNVTQREINIQEFIFAGDLLGVPRLAMQVYKRGGTLQDFYEEFSSSFKTPTFDEQIGIRTRDDQTPYSISRLILSAAERKPAQARYERDFSAMVSSKTGVVPNGEFVPFGVFARDFNLSGSQGAANLTGSPRLGDYVGDPLRNLFLLPSLGATVIPGLGATAHIPGFESSTPAEHLGETAAAPPIYQSTRDIELTPRRVAAQFIFSRQALIQATPELDKALEKQMIAALDEEMTKGILAGDGEGDNQLGILYHPEVALVEGGANGATLLYPHLVDMEDKAYVPEVKIAKPAWVINSATKKYLREKPISSVAWPFILGNDNLLPGGSAKVSNCLPSDLSKGSGTDLSGLIYSSDWSELMIGIYGGGVDLTIDSVTRAAAGEIRVVASLLYGAGLRHPKAFSVMRDAQLT